MVDPREAREIMSQGAIRPETARDRRERRVLAEDLTGSPVKGQPLRQRLRNFRPDASSTVRAIEGPAIWMRRLRAIEDELDWHVAELSEAWLALAAEAPEPAVFARRWQETARTWSFVKVNELIERHNRNFPAESQLPMDPRTRDFVKVNGRSYEREPLDERWILSRFPADVAAAGSL
jgi:hypothetical protein